jgi:hypothetical protein
MEIVVTIGIVVLVVFIVAMGVSMVRDFDDDSTGFRG